VITERIEQVIRDGYALVHFGDNWFVVKWAAGSLRNVLTDAIGFGGTIERALDMAAVSLERMGEVGMED